MAANGTTENLGRRCRRFKSCHPDHPTRRAASWSCPPACPRAPRLPAPARRGCDPTPPSRSEEHTSELQSRVDLVCRLLLEKKKKQRTNQQLQQRKTRYQH